MQKVRPGDALQIPAETFNTFVDVARDFQQRQRGVRRTPSYERQDCDTVLVRNESGADCDRFDVLGIGGPIISPTDNASEFKRQVAVRGVTPADAHKGKFVILLEPAPAQAIVRGCVAGACVVRVHINSEDHGFAEVVGGQVDKLDSVETGSARLLWVEPVEERQDPSVAWTIARLGDAVGSSGGTATAAFAMITSKAGTQPPYRYAAEQATMNADGSWSHMSGGQSYNNVFNIEEQGHGGQWVNPLYTGDVVLICAAPDPTVDAFVCTRSHYRGTY